MNFLTNFTIAKFWLYMFSHAKSSFCSQNSNVYMSAHVLIFSYCMMSYNFDANAIFVIYLALKNNLKHTHENLLIRFTIIVYYCIKLSMHFSEDMWIKGWDISVKGKQFHI
jgi:hypothetical protein